MVIFGCMDRPSVASGAVLAAVTGAIIDNSVLRPGSGGLAEMVDAAPILRELAARGVKCARFDGVPNR